MALLLFYLGLALGISFICSVLEAVILSVSMSYIETKEQEGNTTAKILKKHKLNIDRPLSAILSLNTVAHTVGAAGVGAQAVSVFGESYFGIISAILTLLILILSEILPKTIGAYFWRELAMVTARTITVIIFITYPLVYLSEFITRLIARNKVMQTISREELSVLTHIGTKEGIFSEGEGKIIHNLIRLKSIKARSIMTPRTVVAAAPEKLSLVEFLKNKEFLRYSRIPIYAGTIDNITGYVLKYDILEALANDNIAITLKDFKRPILVVPENLSIPKVFEKLIEKKEHISLIVDEYGGVEGITTMEDIIETLLGLEIMDERDEQIDMQQLAKEKWRVRAQKLNIKLTENDSPDNEVKK